MCLIGSWIGTRVLPMAQSFAQAETDTPLSGKVIVITGATSGIGLSLTRMLSKLGGTVVALGRSPSKLAEIRDDIPTVQTVQVDLVDLESVATAAEYISRMHERIDILVNNAGIHDGFDNLFGEYETKQGYDQVFGVNYLSHFLLTEKIAPTIMNSSNPIVVQVSSLYHWAVDGSDLRPVGGKPPLASQKGGSHGFLVFRSTRSYANTKLAQILHSRALKRRHPLLSKAQIVNVCPAWVLTKIQRNGGIFKHFLGLGAYDVNGWGVASILLAIFDNKKETNTDFYTNTRVSDIFSHLMAFQTGWMYKLGIRDVLGNFMAFCVLLTQRLLPDARGTATSPPSYDERLGDALYDWSMSAVESFL